MTTAYCSRLGVGGGGGAGGTAAARASVIVRTSWRTVPSLSRAVSTSVLLPSRSVSGASTTTDVGGLASALRCTSVPFSVTLTLATPRLEVTAATTTVAGSATRAPSAG